MAITLNVMSPSHVVPHCAQHTVTERSSCMRIVCGPSSFTKWIIHSWAEARSRNTFKFFSYFPFFLPCRAFTSVFSLCFGKYFNLWWSFFFFFIECMWRICECWRIKSRMWQMRRQRLELVYKVYTSDNKWKWGAIIINVGFLTAFFVGSSTPEKNLILLFNYVNSNQIRLGMLVKPMDDEFLVRSYVDGM